MGYINITGTYSGVKFLPDGDVELVFLIPSRQRGELLRGAEEIVQAGLPTLQIKAEKQRKKRSLDANAYCFVLIDKLAAKLNIPKECL